MPEGSGGPRQTKTSSESLLQIQLPNHTLARSVEGSDQVELAYRESEEVHPKSRSRTEHRLAVATRERGLVLGIPREAPVAEDQEIDRECSVKPGADAERT